MNDITRDAVIRTALASRMNECDDKVRALREQGSADANLIDYWQREYEDAAYVFYNTPTPTR